MYLTNNKISLLKIKKKKKFTWRSWDLNPGLSACEADTLPLSYTPGYVLDILHKLNGVTLLLFK